MASISSWKSAIKQEKVSQSNSYSEISKDAEQAIKVHENQESDQEKVRVIKRKSAIRAIV